MKQMRKLSCLSARRSWNNLRWKSTGVCSSCQDAGVIEKYDLTAHVREIGAYLTEKLDELVAANDAVLERRGIGLIQGIKVKKPVGEISSEALKEGLLIISAKGNVLRLVPPLVIEKEHVDEMLEILKKVL